MGALTAARRVILAGALVAVTSCAPPYYGELDAASGLIRQMTPAGTIGPVYIQTASSGSASVRFLPSKPDPTMTSIQNLAITSGFAIASSQTQDYLTFVYSGSGGLFQTGGQGFDFSLAGADTHYPLFQYDVLASAAGLPSIMVFQFDPSTLANSAYEQIQGNASSGQVVTLFGSPTPASNNIFLGYTPIGGSINPSAPAPNDSFSFALSSGASVDVASAPVSDVSSIFPAPSAPALAVNPLPATQQRALLFSNPTRGSLVAQYWSGSGWTTVQWVGGATTAMTAVTGRLDAVLSNGDLVSTDGGNFTLYDSGTDTQVLSVPLKGLQFDYEAWVGSTPYVFFTLPMATHGNSVFGIFAIPTSKIKTIGS